METKDSTDFDDALRWLADWVHLEVEVVVNEEGSEQRWLDGRLETSQDPDVMDGVEEGMALLVGKHAPVVLNGAEFDRASRDADGGVRLWFDGGLEVSVEKLPLLEPQP